ncbi:MAG: sulfatase-like hydrolase/transferase [Candidatus Latescibacteria bacterium]|nr:sulfatase-like hydrolase/transferase [Candidatus Latescibacterota bacterium]
MGRPNILWICSDQQRWDTLGCYGNTWVNTPNIDRLALGGTRFDHCYAQSPVCTPSRASFLTGRYPRTTRCRQNGQDIPDSEMLVTRLLADAGYTCGLAGKLHLSACNPTVTPTMERRISDGYSEFHWSHDSEPIWPTNEYHTWLQAKGASRELRPHPECEYISLGPEPQDHQTTWCAEKTIDFVEAQESSPDPWLFSVNIYDPHHGFDAPESYLERYMDRLDDIPLPNFILGELDNKPPLQGHDHEKGHERYGLPYKVMSDRDHRFVKASYWAMCDLIDTQTGRILQALERTGQAENTLVIYMSDHGEMLGDHGIYLKGPYFYDPAVRVPMIISLPSSISPRINTDLVELTDLAPTLLDAAGLLRYPGMQGQSLWPVLSDQESVEPATREDVYCEYYNAMPWHQNPSAQTTMIRTHTHKLTVDHKNNTGELYDLNADPYETYNLWHDSGAVADKTEMLTRLCNRMAWTVDPLPARTANW